jgi:hypothetical protein
MDPISNADRLVLLLRQRLEERAKSAPAARNAGKPSGDAPIGPADVRALAAIDWTDERPLRRAIVQTLLADQLGPELVNDAQFQQIVSRVSETIEEDPQAAALLTRAISDLRQT